MHQSSLGYGPIAEAVARDTASEFGQKYIANGLAKVVEPYQGITTDSTVLPGLFPIRKTGVSTTLIRMAADEYLAALGPELLSHASFAIDSDKWRKWSNIHRTLMRHGLCLGELPPIPRARAYDLLRASLSRQGFETARGIVRLNETLAEMTGKPDEYGEAYYWLSIFGTPSEREPWGWQLDGHHLNVNYVIVGDQVVMTPAFMGSEVVSADAGRYFGTRVLEFEERCGLELARSLNDRQRSLTVLGMELPRNMYTDAFRDNFELRYEGLPFGELSDVQQGLLLTLIETYVQRLPAGHADVKLTEVRRHLTDMHFAWMGGVDDESVFYYRLHSPVLMVEFEHQRGQALRPFDRPSKRHVHTVVRTPNGNDYGKDLLRQHHQQFQHARAAH